MKKLFYLFLFIFLYNNHYLDAMARNASGSRKKLLLTNKQKTLQTMTEEETATLSENAETQDPYDQSIESILKIEGLKSLNLGTYYFGIKKFKKAFPLIKDAALKYQIPEALIALAIMYKDGLGCEKNIKEALNLCAAAAELGAVSPDLLREIAKEVNGKKRNTYSSPPEHMYT